MRNIFSCASWLYVCLLWQNVYLSVLSIFQLGHFFFKLILWGHHQPDTKTKQGYQREKNYRWVSLMNMDVTVLNKIPANWIQQFTERIIHHDQMGVFLGMQRIFNIHRLISVIHYVNKLKNKNHMIIFCNMCRRKLLTKFNMHLWWKHTRKWA